MAEATLTAEACPSTMLKYFCHQCASSIELTPPTASQDLACPKCYSGCVEEVSADLEASLPRRAPHSSFGGSGIFAGGSFFGSGRLGGVGRTSDLSSLFSNVLFNSGSVGRDIGASDSDLEIVRPREELPREEDSDDDSDEEDGTAGASGLLFTRHRRRSDRDEAIGDGDRNTAFPRFLEHLLEALTGGMGGIQGGAAGGVDSSFPFPSSPFVHSDPRDYAWGTDGLDNVITQLLNQLEGSGPPPATADLISSLPLVPVTQQHTDAAVECSVCMDELEMEQIVHSLPCGHLYHKDCIVPWLQLHGTCPVCRTSLGGSDTTSEKTNPPAEQQQQQQHEDIQQNSQPDMSYECINDDSTGSDTDSDENKITTSSSDDRIDEILRSVPALDRHDRHDGTIGKPDPATSAGRPDPTTSVGRPDPATTVGRPNPTTSVGRPGPTASVGRPGPTTSVGRLNSVAIVGKPEHAAPAGRYDPASGGGRHDPVTAAARRDTVTAVGRLNPIATNQKMDDANIFKSYSKERPFLINSQVKRDEKASVGDRKKPSGMSESLHRTRAKPNTPASLWGEINNDLRGGGERLEGRKIEPKGNGQYPVRRKDTSDSSRHNAANFNDELKSDERRVFSERKNELCSRSEKGKNGERGERKMNFAGKVTKEDDRMNRVKEMPKRSRGNDNWFIREKDSKEQLTSNVDGFVSSSTDDSTDDSKVLPKL